MIVYLSFFNATATTEIYTLSLHDALPILRRDPANSDNFPRDVLELQAYLAPVEPGQKIEAVPGSGTEVPLWILGRSEEHTSELQSQSNLVCRLLLEKKNTYTTTLL